MEKSFWVLLFLIMVSVVASPASTQFSIMGGYSTITSFENELWSGGYYVSGLGLIQVAKGLHVGLWGAYHRWGLKDTYFQEIIDFYAIEGFSVSISGSASNIRSFPA